MTAGPTLTTSHPSSRENPPTAKTPVSGGRVTAHDRLIDRVGRLRSRIRPIDDSTLHLFYVHSGITYVCARMVMSHLGLSPERCLLIIGRRMTLRNSGIRCETMPELDSSYTFSLERWFWKTWRKISRFDHFISRLCGHRGFVIYLPHSQRVLYQLLLSHRQCRGFAFIEEGTDAYICPSELDDHRVRMRPKLQIMSVLNYLGRANHYGRHFRAGYDHCYATTRWAFRHYRRRVVVEPPEGICLY